MSKEDLRIHFKNIRQNISEIRRIEAQKNLLREIKKLCQAKRRVLSFMSVGSEINTAEINQYFLSKNQLCLPKEESESLKFYKVNSIEMLEKNKYGFLEPKANRDFEIYPDENDLIIVPGLAYDLFGHRLGYGRGHFDKFFEKNLIGEKIGIGFVEQLSLIAFEMDQHDKKLDALYLF